jgi:hypothetical protein
VLFFAGRGAEVFPALWLAKLMSKEHGDLSEFYHEGGRTNLLDQGEWGCDSQPR